MMFVNQNHTVLEKIKKVELSLRKVDIQLLLTLDSLHNGTQLIKSSLEFLKIVSYYLSIEEMRRISQQNFYLSQISSSSTTS